MTQQSARRGWLDGKYLKFVALGTLVFLFLRVLVTWSRFEEHLIIPYLSCSTRVSVVVLGWLGRDVEARGLVLASESFAVEIRRGCDAIEPATLFAAAVLAAPFARGRKLRGLLIGGAVLSAANIVRIVSLYLVGAWDRHAFLWMHVAVWQAAFVALVILLWWIWAKGAAQGDRAARGR
jgi:exosortase H (IPTLxxWG-CTERM-specific)